MTTRKDVELKLFGSDSELSVLLPSKVPVSELGKICADGWNAVEPPFSGRRKKFLALLSRRILADKTLRQSSEAVALGYWLRAANLTVLEETYFDPLQSCRRWRLVPVGLVFHVAPANVDTMFVYSWALSFLCGNTNIVRISTRSSGAMPDLINVMAAHWRDEREFGLENWMVSYPHDCNATEVFSSVCAMRVIWGGNETINRLRTVPLNPHASERVFSSKYSIAILGAKIFLNSDKPVQEALIRKFVADFIPFDQMGCSSPHLVFWLGIDEEATKASWQFNQLLETELESKRFGSELSGVVSRRNAGFEFAAEGIATYPLEFGRFAGLLQNKRGCPISRLHVGGGVLMHVRIGNVGELVDFVDDSFQTLTHFGLTREEVYELASRCGTRGLDRVMPIGSALNFEPVWDGHNLFDDLMAKVRVEL